MGSRRILGYFQMSLRDRSSPHATRPYIDAHGQPPNRYRSGIG